MMLEKLLKCYDLINQILILKFYESALQISISIGNQYYSFFIGIKWTRLKRNNILADEMGLGKTMVRL